MPPRARRRRLGDRAHPPQPGLLPACPEGLFPQGGRGPRLPPLRPARLRGVELLRGPGLSRGGAGRRLPPRLPATVRNVNGSLPPPRNYHHSSPLERPAGGPLRTPPLPCPRVLRRPEELVRDFGPGAVDLLLVGGGSGTIRHRWAAGPARPMTAVRGGSSSAS